MVPALRPESQRDVAELTAAVQEAAQVASRRPVLERQLDLLHLEPGADGVHGHRGLAAEPGREREDLLPRRRRERPLAGERLARLEAAGPADQRARRLLRDPEAAALLAGEGGDAEVAAAARAAARARRAGRRRRGAAVPAGASRSASVSAWPFPRCGSRSTRAPARSASSAVPSREPSSATSTLRAGKPPPQLGNRLADPPLLVAGGDEDRRWLAHPAGSGWIGGRMPSSAVSRTP